MLQTKLRLTRWWGNVFVRNAIKNTTKQVGTGGIIGPIISFLIKAAVLIFFGALVLFPLYYMVAESLMTNDETLLTTPKLAPDVPQWDNFNKAMVDGYWKAMAVTAIVTSASIAIKIVITMLMGYAFSLRKWRFKRTVWLGFLSLLMIPEVALLYGQYKVIVDFDIIIGPQVIIALILPFVASVFSGFMFRNAFEVIPDRTKEAAYVDGTSPIKYFIKIAVPMVAPTTWTVAILTGFAAWNSYMWPALLLPATDYDVMNTWLFTTGVDTSTPDSRVMANIRMAAAVLAIAPMFIVYLGFRSRIMRAISRQGSAIKG